MNYNRNETQSWLTFLAELILLGMLVIIAIVVFPKGWELVISLNVCALLFMYRIARNFQQRRLRRRLDEASAVVRAISEDITAKIVVYEGHSDLARFYAEVENLRQTLADKEADRQSMMQVVNTIATNIELEKLLDDMMPQIVDTTRSACSAFYLINQSTNMLEIKHSIGFSKNLYAEFDLSLNEGILGVTASSREIRVLRDVPEDTVYIARTFLGTIKPKSIMAVPVVNQDQLLGVLALVSLYDYTQEHVDNMGLMRYYLGVAVHNGINFEKNKRLTNELKFQNKLIQDLNADLERKVSDRTMFLNDVMDSIKDCAIYAMDTDGIIMAWNTGAEYLLELKSSEVMGKHAEVLYQNDPDRTEKVRRRIDSALRDGRYTESGWRQRQDGSRYHYDMTLFARYSQTGELVGFTNVTLDTTAYKKATAALGTERELSARLMEQIPEGYMLLDADGIIIIANSGARSAMDAYDIVGNSFYSYCRNDSDARRKLADVMDTGMEIDFPATLRSNGKAVSFNIVLIKDAASTVNMLLVKVTIGK